jgi:serine/threonine protein kinase
LAGTTAGILAVEQHIVGAYELGPLLATGTVGEVYRARHRETGDPAVVKFLQATTAREPELQRRFVREVAIAEKLNHPNIVRHFDCGLHDDRIYFAMELVECGTLKDVLQQRGRLPWREAAECAVQVCAALGHAHAMGVIHRDLKPANLFLAADGRVKVGDFGLARDLDRGRLTLEGQTVGTCRYMPPEQITGDADLTGAADLYALGCVLYQSISGQPPYDGKTIVEIFEAHLYTEATPLAELARDCPAALADLVTRLLEKDPLERPASAAAVRTELLRILSGRQPDRSAGQQSDKPAAANLTARLHGAEAEKRRRPWVLWIVAAGIVVAIFAIIFAIWR